MQKALESVHASTQAIHYLVMGNIHFILVFDSTEPLQGETIQWNELLQGEMIQSGYNEMISGSAVIRKFRQRLLFTPGRSGSAAKPEVMSPTKECMMQNRLRLHGTVTACVGHSYEWTQVEITHCVQLRHWLVINNVKYPMSRHIRSQPLFHSGEKRHLEASFLKCWLFMSLSV